MNNWLVTMRRNREFTQDALARRAGVTRQMIAAIEKGVATPSVRVAKAISSVLGIEWTLFYDDSAKTEFNEERGEIDANARSIRGHGSHS